MKTNHIAIIMPAYNEAAVIGAVIAGLPRHYDDSNIDIIVVNDGSTDGTLNIARTNGAILINHIVNSGGGGAGGATSTGLAYARNKNYDYAVTIDADGQHTPEDCLKVIAELKKSNADMIIGSRLINSVGMPWYRIIGNKGLSFFTYLMFGLYVTDSQSGLKGLNRKALETIEIRSQGMEFCSEMIWRAKQQRLRVLEIPIQAVYTPYSLAKGQRNWNAINIVRNLIKRKLLEFINA